MKHTILILFLAASAAVASAQTPAKPASPVVTAPHRAAASAGVKLPPGVPMVKGIVKTAFSLRYEDFKIGAGAEAEPNKMYKVHYTGWLAADGHKFDSSYDHPGQPLKDKDGKPVLGDDGKPKQGDPQPMSFPQGMGRLIPGFDQGFTGMKIGGKRRIFIPWQLAYGAKGRPGPDAAHPGIPPKADLIFDVELVDVTDLPAPQGHPPMGMPGGRPMPPKPGTPGAPPTPAQPGAPAPATAPPAPGAAPKAAAPATPAAPAAPNAAPAPAAPPKPAPPASAPTPAAPAQPAAPNAAPAPPPATSAPGAPAAPAPPATPAQPQPQ
ncbi:MAG: FKBP-type peptidyl-prolyl cis-trans isomerase [Terracidiphilus sp.]|jgi:peptidylprolyl isomerase